MDWVNILETARHKTILEIDENASPTTRQIYERGHYKPGPTYENWIIRWMLRDVFRRARKSMASVVEGREIAPQGKEANFSSGHTVSYQVVTRGYYDPVRNS